MGFYEVAASKSAFLCRPHVEIRGFAVLRGRLAGGTVGARWLGLPLFGRALRTRDWRLRGLSPEKLGSGADLFAAGGGLAAAPYGIARQLSWTISVSSMYCAPSGVRTHLSSTTGKYMWSHSNFSVAIFASGESESMNA